MRITIMLLVVLTLASVACGEPRSAREAAAVAVQVPASTTLAMIERIRSDRAIADVDPRYAPVPDEAGFVIAQPGGLSASIAAQGATLDIAGGRAELRLASVHRGGSEVVTVESFGAARRAATVEIHRGHDITEWWRALPSGLEHGITIAARPAGDGELVLRVACEGALTARAISEAAAELVDSRGTARAHYGDLYVSDARGRTLPAHLRVADAIEIEVDDASAIYPIVVDPLVVAQEATLSTGGTSGLGKSVGITADGSRVALSNDGGAMVFVRVGTSWSLEQMLVAATGRSSVAISGDGMRVIIGSPDDLSQTGSARVFVRAGSVWSLEATLPAFQTGGRFGWSVGLDATGTRAIVGEPYWVSGNPGQLGLISIFVRTGTSWGAEATLSGAPETCFGWAVALSDDGATAVLGAPGCSGGASAIYVLLRSSPTFPYWPYPPPAPGGALSNGDARFGDRVAISGDGRYIAAIGTMGSTQRAQIYSRGPTTWSPSTVQPGIGVGLNADASVAVVGPYDRVHASVLTRSGASWAIEPAQITYAPGVQTDQLNWPSPIALSADGFRAVLGDSFASGGAGVGTVYTLLYSTGTACLSGTQCSSGFCVDGFCCDSACGGGASDCQACSNALTAVANGTCAPLSAASSVVCRPSVGACDIAESCVMGSTACPADMAAPAGGVCRASAGPCDVVEVCTGTPSCPADTFSSSSTSCRASLGGCDPAELCTGSSAACPADVRLGAGAPCGMLAGTCDVADHCDGTSVACPDTFLPANTVCRPTAGSCDLQEVCSGSSGACPGDTFAAPGMVCRAAASGGCDVAESCAGGPTCPPDAFMPAMTDCRPAIGACDVTEQCTGASATCPANAFAMAGTVCNGFVLGPCDAPDTCDGTSVICPPSYMHGVECRPIAGPCDVAEVCSGASAACPSDQHLAAGVNCGGTMAGSCSSAGTCNGTSVTCPGGMPFAAGTVCMARDPANPCSVDWTCDGTTTLCNAQYAPSTTVCAPTTTAACDGPHTCSGTSNACVAHFASGVVCRPASGACDVAESCNGTAPTCPPDSLEGSGTVCRAPTASCDPAESCDGTSATCPSDVTMCMSMPDTAMRDASVLASDAGGSDGATRDATPISRDASSGVDAGSAPPPMAGSCGCRTGRRGGASAAMIAMLLALAWRVRRRS